VFVAPSPIPPRLRLNRILAFGDSITVGEIITPNTDNLLLTITPSAAYPTILSQLLKERYGDQPAVFNAGLSGEKAVNADRRFAPTLGAFSPEVVVLLEGSNDLLYAEPAAGVESAIQGLGVIAAEARNRRLRVFLCTLPPTKPGRRNIPLGIIQAANDRIRNLARTEGAAVIDLFTPLLQDLDANIGPDGLHPTVLGYRRIAETVFAALRADLEIK
jgi:lysophospholipase L1-like esterase